VSNGAVTPGNLGPLPDSPAHRLICGGQATATLPKIF